jgi:hypothetical protein
MVPSSIQGCHDGDCFLSSFPFVPSVSATSCFGRRGIPGVDWPPQSRQEPVSIVLIPERFDHDPAGRADASPCPEERTSADQIRMNRQYTALPRQFFRVTDGRRITSMTALSANADQSHNARLQRLCMVL